MENLFEIIIPLIFAVIYFLSTVFGKSQNKEDSEEIDDEEFERALEAEAAEHRRIAQEEARNRAEQLPPEPPEPQQRHQQDQRVNRGPNLATPFQQTRRPATSSPTPPPTPWETANEMEDAYETAMQAQLEKIEATRQQAEKLKQQAQSGQTKTSASGRSRTTASIGLSGSVRDNLKDPKAARLAFIYGEVLGPPVSQRKSNSAPSLI